MRLWSGFSLAEVSTTAPFKNLLSFKLGWSGFFTIYLEFGLDS
jgi:hypothetical protein